MREKKSATRTQGTGERRGRIFFLVWCGFSLAVLGCSGKKTGVTLEQADQAVADARTAYQALMELNPPQVVEYQPRVLLKQAEQLLAEKKYSEAQAKAEQAREQADLARQAREQMIAETRKKLGQSKGELELMFFPGLRLVKMYWETVGKLDQKQYDEAKQMADQLGLLLAKEKELSYAPSRMMTVLASDEDLRLFGWPRIYEQVLSDCRLSNVVDTVEPQKQVKFIRMVLCNPKVTFYLVENPRTGRQGWIAERYVSQARAESH